MTALLPLGTWVPILDGDPVAAAMYERHYSSARSRDRRRERGATLFLGPGEKLVLMTPKRTALFAWHRQRYRQDGEHGVECAIFHRQRGKRASDPIRAADAIADRKWPGERHFTFVDPIQTTARRDAASPIGRCFVEAGWRDTGRRTARGLHVLERVLVAMERAA